ncbi:hypothetical protein [Humidisolicoccus flavus]|uniref:hypothetical protein n=1 Tax=Humidisolicoccus flavus TaxID=3111414 RepID=UPI0032561C68
MRDEMNDQVAIPPELDPEYDRFDDGRPARTMFNRFRPVFIVVAVLVLVAFVLVGFRIF